MTPVLKTVTRRGRLICLTSVMKKTLALVFKVLSLQSIFSVIGALGSVCLLHTSPTMEKHRNVRKGLRVPKMTPRHIEILKNMHNRRPYWHKPLIVPTSPLSRTTHPKNQFEAEDRKIQEEVLAKSTPDEPIDITEFSKLANQATKDEVKGQHCELHSFHFLIIRKFFCFQCRRLSIFADI